MSEIRSIPINRIIVSGDNPRQHFDDESLRRLGESIESHGLIQPIVVRPKDGYFELIVGERRLRAVELMGMTEIEARIEDLDDVTTKELRLIENTHREDLTDAEKGDAVFALLEHYPEKYPTLKNIADSINKSYRTIQTWTKKSEKLSPKVKAMIAGNQLTERDSVSLLKYDHLTQNKLVAIIQKYGLHRDQVRSLCANFDANPSTNLDELAEEVLGIRKVEIDITKLSEESKREVEKILEERKKKAEEARKNALEKAQKAPRRPRPKPRPRTIEHKPEKRILEKAEKITEKLAELEPEQQENITEAVSRQLESLAKRVDKDVIKYAEEVEAKTVSEMKEEIPERFIMHLIELLHGIWDCIGVETPQSLKENSQTQLISSLTFNKLKEVQRIVIITVKELEDFNTLIERELFTKKSRLK